MSNNISIREIKQKQLKDMLNIYENKGTFPDDYIGLFICKENEKYLGIDNVSEELFIEEFDIKEECLKYLNNEDE